MKSLRKTIRKILLENQSHYDKIADLICSEKIESINTALELARGMDYIGDYTYREETHYASRSHGWTFDEYDETFLSVLSDRIKEITLFRRPGSEGISFVSPFDLGTGGSVTIIVIELPPYE